MRTRLLALWAAACLAVLVALPGVAAATASKPTSSAALPTTVSKAALPATAQGGTKVTGPRMCKCTVNANGNLTNTSNYKYPSTVTVSQTANLGNQDVLVTWTGFTSTYYVNGNVGYDPEASVYTVMVAECQGYHPASPNKCYTAGGVGALSSNDAYQSTPAYSVTGPNGKGEANIELLTSVQMQTPIRCDSTHPCSLVIVPAQGGISSTNCSHSGDLGTVTPDGPTPPTAVGSSDFFFSAGHPWQCSWDKRITVPLHFAPGLANCPKRSPDFSAEGSPMLADAMTQWQAALCLGASPVTVNYNGTVNEDQARNDFQSGITDVAFSTVPMTGSAKHPFTYAPVAISAASVAYWVDNQSTGLPYTTVNLTPLLLAKQLTTSYNYNGFACHPTPQEPPSPPYYPCDNAVDWNPMTIFSDPDFQEYNPGSWTGLTNNTSNFDTPIVVSGNSDMTWVATSWIAASKKASQFLAGKTESGKQYQDACLNNLTQEPIACHPHVNKNYLQVTYPVNQILAADSNIDFASQYVPVFPLSSVVTDMLNYQPSGYNYRPPPPGSPTNPALAAQTPGQRDLWALIDEADAALNLFPTAYLQNAAGKFVQPTDQSMLAAVKDMTVNPDGITLSTNFATKDPAAYPLTMVVYAIVPTGGISTAKAASIASFLDYVANAGQQPGEAIGDLALGYAPLPQSLRQQTLAAAYKVLHQTGDVKKKSSSSSSSPSPSSSPSSSPSPSKSPSKSPSPSPTPKASSTPTAHSIAISFSSPDAAGMSWVVFALLLAGGVLLVTGPAALIVGSPGARAAIGSAARRIKRVGSRMRNQQGMPSPPWRRNS
jgi:hypothetical protein